MLVDLSEVGFLASIGIRLLTMNAQSLSTRDGRMGLVNPIPEVQNVLELTGIPASIPIYSSSESAETILLALGPLARQTHSGLANVIPRDRFQLIRIMELV